MATQPTTTKPRRKMHPSHDEFIETLTKLGYEFKLNLLDDSIEVNGERITKILHHTIRDQLRDKGFRKYLVDAKDAYIAEAGKNAYHPVRDYLYELKWDGGNYISQLSTYFIDKHDMFHIYLRRWLIGAVAKVYTGHQNMMLVLEGPQNIGKSYFARWLCPLQDLYLDAPIDPSNKDDTINLITRWLWEVNELDATTRRAVQAALKSFITRESVTVRVPYAEYPIVKPALASFIGTFNDEAGILTDSSGNRRFNIVSLTEIDWNYANDVDLNSVWGEAQAAYQSGESCHLTPDERERQEEINKDFYVTDPVEDLLRKCFMLTYDKTDWMATADILTMLQNAGLTGNTRVNAMALASTMKRLGLEKYKFNRVNGYYGIK